MKESMENQMGIGAEIIEQVWDRLKPYELPSLRSMPAERVVVVKGDYDHVEKILKNAKKFNDTGIKYDVINDDLMNLLGKEYMFYNGYPVKGIQIIGGLSYKF